MTDNRPIAFFDSGVGGLTVFAKVKKLLPNENCLYFVDTKNMPYGDSRHPLPPHYQTGWSPWRQQPLP